MCVGGEERGNEQANGHKQRASRALDKRRGREREGEGHWGVSGWVERGWIRADGLGGLKGIDDLDMSLISRLLSRNEVQQGRNLVAPQVAQGPLLRSLERPPHHHELASLQGAQGEVPRTCIFPLGTFFVWVCGGETAVVALWWRP